MMGKYFTPFVKVKTHFRRELRIGGRYWMIVLRALYLLFLACIPRL